MSNVSIKSDGTLNEFEPITPEGLLKVKLTVVDIKLDVTAALVKMHRADAGWMHSYSGGGFVDPGEQIGRGPDSDYSECGPRSATAIC